MEDKQRKRNFGNDENPTQRKVQCLVKGDSRPIGDVVKFGSGLETNQQRIEMRNKQIQFGKNTIGYDNYLSLVPKNSRKNLSVHPRTPNPYDDVSKRCFDGQIKAWRRELHKWDNMELSLQVGVNRKQGAAVSESVNDAKEASTTASEKTMGSIGEELEEDNYNSDTEGFGDEDIL